MRNSQKYAKYLTYYTGPFKIQTLSFITLKHTQPKIPWDDIAKGNLKTLSLCRKEIFEIWITLWNAIHSKARKEEKLQRLPQKVVGMQFPHPLIRSGIIYSEHEPPLMEAFYGGSIEGSLDGSTCT